jgi:hypothetical protein
MATREIKYHDRKDCLEIDWTDCTKKDVYSDMVREVPNNCCVEDNGSCILHRPKGVTPAKESQRRWGERMKRITRT